MGKSVDFGPPPAPKTPMQQVVADRFNSMRDMLTSIEEHIANVEPEKQLEFTKPISYMIVEAWQDACNPGDSFLYPAEPVVS